MLATQQQLAEEYREQARLTLTLTLTLTEEYREQALTRTRTPIQL